MERATQSKEEKEEKFMLVSHEARETWEKNPMDVRALKKIRI